MLLAASVASCSGESGPSAPVNLHATAGNAEVTLTWTASSASGVTGYTVQRATSVTGPYLALAPVMAPSLTDTGLNNGSTYYYEVAATNASGTGAFSAAVSATPLPAPPYTTGTILVSAGPTPGAMVGSDFVGLSYEKSKLRPYVSGANSAWTLSSTDSTLVAYMQLLGPSILRVGGNSVDYAPYNPLDLAATTGLNAVSLTWAAAPGATGYTVLRTEAPAAGTSVDGNYTSLATVTTTAYTDTTGTPNTTYNYEVVPSGGSSASVYISKVSASPGAPPAPTEVAASAGNGQVVLAWPAVTGAVVASYTVLRGTASGGETSLAPGVTSATSTVSYTDTTADNDHTYYYAVEAVNSAGASGKSNEVEAFPTSTSDGGIPTVTPKSLTNIHPADIDNLASLLRATGWKVIYGMDFQFNQPIPSRLGDEAAYAASAFGSSLSGFEIGNEPDLYKNYFTGPAPYSLAQFLAQWLTFDAAILAEVPDAGLTGPAVCCEWTEPNGWFGSFASSDQGKFALLTGHYYSSNPRTMDGLLAVDPKLTSHLQVLASTATTYDVPQGFRLAEANSFAQGGQTGVSNAYGSALWVIDFLFTNAANGSMGVNLHGGGGGNYTPIVDNNEGMATAVRPEYYGAYFFLQSMPGTLLNAATNLASELNFSAYAVAGANGRTAIILNNKDASNSVVVTMTLPQAPTTATMTILTDAAGLNDTSATGTTLNGATIQPMATWTPPTPTSIPVASGGAVIVTVPPASAVLVSTK